MIEFGNLLGFLSFNVHMPKMQTKKEFGERLYRIVLSLPVRAYKGDIGGEYFPEPLNFSAWFI